MEKKIIKLTKETDRYECLLCCERLATTKLEITRPKYGDGVVGFHICDECLAKMQKDIETCE